MLTIANAKAKFAAGNVAEAFKNEEGAIDLASIMVGIIVIGLIGGVIAATVFAVIPWAQDNAAKQSLTSVTTAQGVDKAKNGHYDSASGLASANLLPSVNALYMDSKVTSSGGWAAAVKSDSGQVWLNTDKNTLPVNVTGQSYTATLQPPTPGTPYVSYNTGGSLPAGTYYYVLTSISNGESVASSEITVTTTGANGSVSIPWTPAPGSLNVVVYRSGSSGTETKITQVGGQNYYVDGNQMTPGTSTPPTTSGGTYTGKVSDVASALATQ